MFTRHAAILPRFASLRLGVVLRSPLSNTGSVCPSPAVKIDRIFSHLVCEAAEILKHCPQWVFDGRPGHPLDQWNEERREREMFLSV